MHLADMVAATMRRLYERGLVDALGGNVSVRVRLAGLQVVLITPGGIPKYVVSGEDIAAMTLEGVVLYGRPSSEYRMHLEIYKRVGEATAVIHAHPHSLTRNWRILENLEAVLDEEHLSLVRCVVRVPYRRPGSPELAIEAAQRLAESGCRLAVLEKHGVVAYGTGEPLRALAEAEAIIDLLEGVTETLAWGLRRR